MTSSNGPPPSPSLPDIFSKTFQQHIVTVTPAVAEIWLGHNADNRPLRQAQVDALTGAIQRGEWKLDGSPIRFDTNGNLVDGQHRLWAIIEADTPVEVAVVVGLEPDTRLTVDSALAKRSTSDTLRMGGHPQATQLASTINHFWKWQIAEAIRTSRLPSIQQALAVLAEHPGLENSLKDVGAIRKRFRLASGMIAATHYVFATIDADDANTFFEALKEGTNLAPGDPILVLRNYLETQLVVGASSRANKLTHQALIIKAWNAWRDGETITVLTWKSGGMRAEAFPVPH